MKKKYFKIGITIIAVITVTVVFLKLNKKTEVDSMGENNITLGSTTTVKRGSIKTNITGSGNVQSKIVKELKTKNNGTINNVYASEGQRLDKEDTILDLRNESDSIAINQSNLNIIEEKNRLKELKEEAENLLVRSPVSGIINEIFVEDGDEISSNQKFLNIIDKSVLEVVAPFNNKQVEKMNVGDNAEVVVLGSYQTIKGKITKISKEGYGTDNGGLMNDVTVELKNPGALIEGKDVQVRISKNGFYYTSPKESNKLKWKTNKEIEFKIKGILSEINIEENQKVNKGDILGKINNENHLRSIQVQEERLKNRKLELSNKKKKLDDDVIYAPIAGTLIDIDVVPGENIASEEVVAKVADLDNLEVTIPVDELDILKVKKNQEAIINVPALKEVEFKGKVTNISEVGKIENGISTFDVTISIYKPQNLKLGMSANVEILLDSKENVLMIPVDCVNKREDKYYIKVPNGNGEAKEIEVEVGLVSKDFAEVKTDKIEEGDKVLKGTVY